MLIRLKFQFKNKRLFLNKFILNDPTLSILHLVSIGIIFIPAHISITKNILHLFGIQIRLIASSNRWGFVVVSSFYYG